MSVSAVIYLRRHLKDKLNNNANLDGLVSYMSSDIKMKREFDEQANQIEELQNKIEKRDDQISDMRTRSAEMVISCEMFLGMVSSAEKRLAELEGSTRLMSSGIAHVESTDPSLAETKSELKRLVSDLGENETQQNNIAKELEDAKAALVSCNKTLGLPTNATWEQVDSKVKVLARQDDVQVEHIKEQLDKERKKVKHLEERVNELQMDKKYLDTKLRMKELYVERLKRMRGGVIPSPGALGVRRNIMDCARCEKNMDREPFRYCASCYDEIVKKLRN